MDWSDDQFIYPVPSISKHVGIELEKMERCLFLCLRNGYGPWEQKQHRLEIFNERETKPHWTHLYQTRAGVAAMSNGNREHLITVAARAMYANLSMTMVEVGKSISIYICELSKSSRCFQRVQVFISSWHYTAFRSSWRLKSPAERRAAFSTASSFSPNGSRFSRTEPDYDKQCEMSVVVVG